MQTVSWIAERLTEAQRPLLITSKVGRRPEGFTAVTRLADLAAVRVIDTAESGCLNIPSSHPMNVLSATEARELVGAADLILVVDCDVPWIPRFVQPRDDALIIQLDADPVKTDMPLWTFPVDVAVTADGATALGQIVRHLEEHGRDALELPPAAVVAPAGESDGPITTHEVVEALNAVLLEGDIVVEESVTNAGVLHQVLERSLPGTLYGTGSPGLGWGLGGAVGVSLASPGRRVVTVVGDGSFMFGVPTAALSLAAELAAPILVVVLNNDGYKASRLPVFELFPEGLSAGRGDAMGTRFTYPPDFAAVARACHADGEQVRDRAELVPALRRALEAVDSGRSAVLDVHIARS
jgi:acetolactate synthase-1/2/3 large subunit